ncbi:hypothetical protein D3C75_406490 [compost metagenome]
MTKKEEKLLSIYGFVTSRYYKNWKSYLLKILRISRSSRFQRLTVHGVSLQIAILRTLTELETAIGEQLKSGSTKYDLKVLHIQRMREIIKEIADGYAWRVLGFNRPLIRFLSQNNSSGYIGSAISNEDLVAANISMEGKNVLIHDITNILRIGDLTVLESNGFPHIVELKRSGKKIWTYEEYLRILKKGGTLSNQGAKILEINSVIRTGQITIGSSYVNLGRAVFPVETYLKTVQEVIKRCQINESGFCERHIDDVMFVRAIHTPRLNKQLSVPFKKTMDKTVFSNIDTYFMKNAEVFRNKVPYSVFPFPDRDVIQLLSGEIILESFINFTALKKSFESFGWKVRRIQFEENNELNTSGGNFYSGNKLFPFDYNTTMFVLSKDGFNIEIGMEMIGLIYHDFLKPSYINKIANILNDFSREKRQEGYWGMNMDGEKLIWK